MTERGSARRGYSLEKPDAYEAIRRAAEANKDWPFAHQLVKLNRWANGEEPGDKDCIKNRLYPVIHTPEYQGQLPPVFIAIEHLSKGITLASYNLDLDGYGLPHRITLNKKHFKIKDGKAEYKYGDWALAEVLTHETGHHWQQMLGEDPFTVQSKVTHNKEFCDKMRQLGMYSNSDGQYYKLADVDGPFGVWAKEKGLKRPKNVPKGDEGHWFYRKRGKPKGGSTLNKECCSNCGEIRYSGKQAETAKPISCVPCSDEMGETVIYIRPEEGMHQTIYVKPKE